ncbi:Transcriptional regulator, MarR family [Desulfonema limicola]|uniref:Transcriptional regulator, MarR family n=1 Tax=Desulfonema limicola TaxID=45656 RepID=A0A975BE37_9BACT|nr:MarR family transcriptional regulator [Desulfonema limicola]QTA83702.1 Transcriptional regulator, MarR family [Desulfonema limicola]
MIAVNPLDHPYYLLSRVTLLVTSAFRKELLAADVKNVKPAYLGVLIALWKEDGMKVIELGRRAGLEPSSMTGLLDRMERDGLSFRAADPNDRRAQLIYLTARGRDIQEKVMDVVDRVMGKIFKDIPCDDMSTTLNVLRKIIINAN